MSSNNTNINSNKRNFSEISCNSNSSSVSSSKKQKGTRGSRDSALFSLDNATDQHQINLCRLQSSSEDDFVDVESLTAESQKSNNNSNNIKTSQNTKLLLSSQSSSGHSSPRSTTRSSESIEIDVEGEQTVSKT